MRREEGKIFVLDFHADSLTLHNINNERIQVLFNFVWLIFIQSKGLIASLFECYLHISYY